MARSSAIPLSGRQAHGVAMSNDTTKVALVLGATGGIGGTVARTLVARGWHVRAMGRDAAGAAKKHPAFTWVQGDAMNAADVRAAAEGAALIVHAVNPTGYKE